jgi:hypothetical protein
MTPRPKVALEHLSEHVTLFLDPKTGLAWIEDYHTGLGHSCHPSIDRTGSVRGMKAKGYWRQADRVVESHGFKYNIDLCYARSEYDRLTCRRCRCGGNHAG